MMIVPRCAYPLTATGLSAVLALALPAPGYASWGVHAPGAGAAASARVLPAAGTPDATANQSSVTVSWPQVLVAPGTPADGYLLTRYDADTGAPATPVAGCAGTVSALQCTESPVPDGRWRYAVRATQGRNWTGPIGSPSPTVAITTTPGTAVVTFPVSGQTYGTAGYPAGCGTTGSDLCGTATPSGSASLTAVRVSVRRDGTGYWDPSTGGFTSATERLFAVSSGLRDWRVDFPLANFAASGAYTLRVVADDDAGRTATGSSGFVMDTTAPRAVDVQASNTSGSVAGRIDPGDQLTLTYSEQLHPASVLAGWTGGTTAVTIQVERGNGSASRDELTVYRPDGTRLTSLGTVSLGQRGYVSQSVSFGATMIQDGASIRLTLGTPSANRSTTAPGPADLSWTPGPVTDPAGNPLANSATAVTELRQPTPGSPADLDF